MNMCDDCPFLESKPGKQGLLCCAAGVNFYSVGQARELCQLCPFFDGRWTLSCEFIEIYTFLRTENGQQRIDVRFDCWLPEDEAIQPRCASCSAADALFARGNVTPEVQSFLSPQGGCWQQP